jgi:hypothetical protein
MNTRQQGNRLENTVSAFLAQRGYFCYPSRGSRGIDIIALHDTESHLGLEVGTTHKRAASAFEKMLACPRPAGMVCLVVRKTKRKNRVVLRWHVAGIQTGFLDFDEALAAAREA